jgi:hypothetical protein
MTRSLKSSRSLEFLAREYARSRREAGLVSVAMAARAIGALMPECAMGGRELDDMIARCALAEGRTVVFDRSWDGN